MPNKPSGWTDERVERIIGTMLQAGVLLSGAVVAVGGAIDMVRHGSSAPHYALFRGESPEFRTVSGIVTGVMSFHGRGIIQLGLLMLIATPVARVAFSAVAFALERDGLYVVVTLVVLIVLAFSLVGGHL